MIRVSSRGNFKKIEAYLLGLKKRELFKNLNQYGRLGVLALSSATPQDSGATADSWQYNVILNERWPGIEWYNTNITRDGTPVAILIQYDHGTGTGGYVQGRDFINPAMRPIFDQIVADLREKVKP